MLLAAAMVQPASAQATFPDAAPRVAGEGDGPYTRLLIEGGTVIDGTGAPPRGPVNIVVEGNRIVSVGESPPDGVTHRIDAKGLFIVPGMVDTHVRVMNGGRDMTPDYALKLLLAHGVTTITSMQPMQYLDWALKLSQQSARNEIVAPRVQPWADYRGKPTAAETKAELQKLYARGVRGLGEGAIWSSPDVIKESLIEAKRLGFRVSWHMNPLHLYKFNALEAARAGLNGLAHWYNLPETMFEGQALQHYPEDYNYADVRSRFRQSGRLWKQAAPSGSELRERVLNEFRALDFTFEPTFSVYEANRDYMGTRNAEWNKEYLHPVLAREFQPSATGSFAHFYDWSSTDEVEWRENFRLWMQFLNEYKNRGGRVVLGTDSGFMWTTFGFGFIRNMELLQEAGFTPLEVLSSATRQGAEHLNMASQVGTIEVGKLADLVIVNGDPMKNLKVFYGTGIETLASDGRVVLGGGVKYTIKDGIVFDAPKLLTDVREMVAKAKQKAAATVSSNTQH